MEKPAETDYPIEEILRRRWSPRAFADRAVEPEKLQSLWEAARWAASSFNEQPWYFIVATKEKPEEHANLLGDLLARVLMHEAVCQQPAVSEAEIDRAKQSA